MYPIIHHIQISDYEIMKHIDVKSMLADIAKCSLDERITAFPIYEQRHYDKQSAQWQNNMIDNGLNGMNMSCIAKQSDVSNYPNNNQPFLSLQQISQPIFGTESTKYEEKVEVTTIKQTKVIHPLRHQFPKYDIPPPKCQ